VLNSRSLTRSTRGKSETIGETTARLLIERRDYQSNGNLCEIYMETTNGANCYAAVTCNDGKLGKSASEIRA
jgi:hypothetical protein